VPIIVRDLYDTIGVVDEGHICALVLLVLSAAFDTVDNSILINVLIRQFGLEETGVDPEGVAKGRMGAQAVPPPIFV